MALNTSRIAILAALTVLSAQLALCDIDYFQTNLTSDLPGVAQNHDPNLVNPWGIAFAPNTPFWISDNGSGLSTLYNGAGQAIPLVVTIPPPAGGTSPAAPTGVVANTGTGFGGSHFIFATEDGTISAWTGGTSATLEVDNSASGAVYKGLTLGNNGGSELLYAANFNSGNVDVFNSSFAQVTVPGGFSDPGIPAGYAPFDIQNIGGMLYVTYALQDSQKHDDVAGPGHGFVDVFNTAGMLQGRLISQGALNSPWGLALAPSTFGPFGGDLLVGNFGDGEIDAYDPTTGAFLGVLTDSMGNPLIDQGLWGLAFGNGSNGFSTNSLYFTAGIPGPGNVEDHGLFGVIQPTPEPSLLLPIGLISLFALLVRRRRRQMS
jgi:uncharacterized protein (TIGR03118 family)